MRAKLIIPKVGDTLFEYSLEMPCRFNQGDALSLENILDMDKIDDDEKKAVAKENYFVKMTAFQKDEAGIFQFVVLARG